MRGFGEIMTLEETTKYLPAQAGKMIRKDKIPAVKIEIGKKNNGRPEGSICEQFGYLPHMTGYTKLTSYIPELGDIG